MQRRKGKTYTTECRVSENTKERKIAFLNEQCKKIDENNRMGEKKKKKKLEISSRKLDIPREHFR